MNIHGGSRCPPREVQRGMGRAMLSLLGRLGGRGAFMNIHEYSWGVQVPPREFGTCLVEGHTVLIGPLGRPGRLHEYSRIFMGGPGARLGGRGAFMNIHEYSWGVQVPPPRSATWYGEGHAVLIGPLGRPGRLHEYS